MLETTDASFGRCLGRLRNIPYDSPGPWNFPAFIHKSSESDECFDFNLEAQLATTTGGKVVNVCTYHPLGPYWRDLFCDTMDTIGEKTNTTQTFCDDFHWYRKAELADDYDAWS